MKTVVSVIMSLLGGRIRGGAITINATRAITIDSCSIDLNSAYATNLPLTASGGAASLQCMSTGQLSPNDWCWINITSTRWHSNHISGAASSMYPIIAGTGPLSGGALHIVLGRLTWIAISASQFISNNLITEPRVKDPSSYEVKPIEYFGGAIAVDYVLAATDWAPLPTWFAVHGCTFDHNSIIVSSDEPIEYPEVVADGIVCTHIVPFCHALTRAYT